MAEAAATGRRATQWNRLTAWMEGASGAFRHTPCALELDYGKTPARELPMQLRISSAALFAASILTIGCGRGNRHGTDSAAGAVDSTSIATANVPASDTTHGAISATTDAIGPGIQVTPTDAHNVNRSFDLRLDNNNWSKFVKAADSVAALRARDPQVRQHLDEQVVGGKTDDAGLKWLESDPKVNSAIVANGLSVKDYYRLGIVTATAVRFMNDPKAAPPTPAGRSNADFVRAHQADLEHLRAVSQGTPVVQAKP